MPSKFKIIFGALSKWIFSIDLNLLLFIFVRISLLYFPFYVYRSSSLLKAIVISFPLLLLLLFNIKYKKEQHYWKSENYPESNKEMITKWGAIEKIIILLSQYWKIKHFEGAPIIFLLTVILSLYPTRNNKQHKSLYVCLDNHTVID